MKAYILSCEARLGMLRATIDNLARTDWGCSHVRVVMDSDAIEKKGLRVERKQDRQSIAAKYLLETAIDEGGDWFLFLEDDVIFNLHLRRNLERWDGFHTGGVLMGLYNPNIQETPTKHRVKNARWVLPECVYGSQAFVVRRCGAQYMVSNWERIPGMQDIKMSRLAGEKGPIFYHSPSLVQHVGKESVWGGHFHQCGDFDEGFLAEEAGT